MNLGENIYRLRTKHNMSQDDLANTLDVSRQSVSKWENNQAVPDLEKLVKMSKLFHITLDELVNGEAQESTSASQPIHPAQLLAGLPTRKIVGCILLVCAFLLLLIPTAMGNPGAGLILAIPFCLCGLTCFLFQQHVGFWCCWAVYLPFSFIPIEQYIRSDICMMIQLFIRIPLLIGTVLTWQKEPLTASKKIYWFLGVGYSLWSIWFSMWLATLSWQRTELYTDFDLMHILEVLTFPLFTALLTTSLRLLKK